MHGFQCTKYTLNSVNVCTVWHIDYSRITVYNIDSEGKHNQHNKNIKELKTMSTNELEKKSKSYRSGRHSQRKQRQKPKHSKTKSKPKCSTETQRNSQQGVIFAVGLLYYPIALTQPHSKKNTPKCTSSTQSNHQAVDFQSLKRKALI